MVKAVFNRPLCPYLYKPFPETQIGLVKPNGQRRGELGSTFYYGSELKDVAKMMLSFMGYDGEEDPDELTASHEGSWDEIKDRFWLKAKGGFSTERYFVPDIRSTQSALMSYTLIDEGHFIVVRDIFKLMSTVIHRNRTPCYTSTMSSTRGPQAQASARFPDFTRTPYTASLVVLFFACPHQPLQILPVVVICASEPDVTTSACPIPFASFC